MWSSMRTDRFFVTGAWQGEIAEFRVTGFKKRNGFAELVRVLEPSPARTTPPCPHHGFGAAQCGGCGWQFVTVEAQLEQKQQRVRQAMARLGVEDKVRAIWASPNSLGYRNRAQFKTDGQRVGYVAAKSNRLVPIEDCPILTQSNRATLAKILALLPSKAWRSRKKDQWTTLDIDEQTTIDSLDINQRRPFGQGNTAQNVRIRAWLAQQLESADRTRPVLELFAGSGNLTEIIADKGFSAVIAVEAVAEVVDTLNSSSLDGVGAVVANLFDETVVKSLIRSCSDVGTLVLDPPRDGFKCMESLLESATKLGRIFYISCDLATFSRDLQVAQQHGFDIEEIQPLDMFPHTPHVELMASAVRVV